MTRRELLSRISSREITLWAAEFHLRAWEREEAQRRANAGRR